MAQPPDYNSLKRAQRIASNKRLSFNYVVQSGAPTAQSIAVPPVQPTATPTPTPTPTVTPTPIPTVWLPPIISIEGCGVPQVNNVNLFIQNNYNLTGGLPRQWYGTNGSLQIYLYPPTVNVYQGPPYRWLILTVNVGNVSALYVNTNWTNISSAPVDDNPLFSSITYPWSATRTSYTPVPSSIKSYYY